MYQECFTVLHMCAMSFIFHKNCTKLQVFKSSKLYRILLSYANAEEMAVVLLPPDTHLQYHWN